MPFPPYHGSGENFWDKILEYFMAGFIIGSMIFTIVAIIALIAAFFLLP